MRRLSTVLSLALRNLLRNKSRSALTLGAVLMGSFASISLSSFGNGLGVLLTRDVVNSKVGALQIHRRGYSKERDNQPLDLTMPAAGEIYDRIRAVPGVRAVSGRIVFAGLVNNGREATMFIGRGVDPTHEYEVLTWAKTDVVGTPVNAGQPEGAVFGAELADALGLASKSQVTIQAATQAGRQNALDLTMVGKLDNANIFESKRFVHLPLAFTQELLGMKDQVTEIVVGVDELEAVDTVASALRKQLGEDYEVETWSQLQPNVAEVVRFQAVVIGMVSFVFLVIVVFGVMNTMLMSVLERTREIGTMMALGLKRQRITGLFLAEAAFLASFGSSLGVAASLGAIRLIELGGGFAVAAPGSTVERYHLVPIPVHSWVVAVFCAAIVGAMLAAAYPAYKASRLRPVEALRAT